MNQKRIVLFANTDWYLYNFRMSLLLQLRLQGAHLLLLSPPGAYGQQLRDLGFDWRPLAMERRSLQPLKELALIVTLIRLFRTFQPDLVHGLTIKCAVYGALAARVVGCGRVSAINGLGYVFTSRDNRAMLLRPVVKALMKLAFGGKRSRIVVQNEDDQRAVAAGGIPLESVRLIRGSGVDLSRFQPMRRSRSLGMPFRILMPARLLWDKGIGEFVEAARYLRGQNIECLVAGDPDPGNPASVPQPTVEAWRREGVITLLGHVSDITVIFGEVDAVALPSYREGLPKGLVEAAACGLPLVTTDVPGCRHVVSDCVDGLLVPAKDSASLAKAFATLAADEVLCARLGAAARAKALRLYDDRIIVAKTLDLYAECADLRRS